MSSEELEEYKRIINKKEGGATVPPPASPSRDDTIGDTTDPGRESSLILSSFIYMSNLLTLSWISSLSSLSLSLSFWVCSEKLCDILCATLVKFWCLVHVWMSKDRNTSQWTNWTFTLTEIFLWNYFVTEDYRTNIFAWWTTWLWIYTNTTGVHGEGGVVALLHHSHVNQNYWD